MAEGGRRHSSFEERPPSPIKHSSTLPSGNSDPPVLDGSFLLQLLQKKPQATSSSSSHPLLPHEAFQTYQDSAVVAIGHGLPFLPHSLLSHPQPTGFPPPSWAPPTFSSPDVGNRNVSGGQQLFPIDDGSLGFQPSGVIPPNSAPLNTNHRRISPCPPHGRFLAPNYRTRNLSGKKVSGYRGQEEKASIRPPPGFEKAGTNCLSEFSNKMEGGARSQIRSAESNQQWRPSSRPEWRPTYNEEGRNGVEFKMSRRLNSQNDRIERQYGKQSDGKILDNDARHRGLPNGYLVYREKSCYSGGPILNTCDSMEDKSSGESDKDLMDDEIEEQSNQILEDLDHVEIGRFSSRNEASSEEDLLGKLLAAALSDQWPSTKTKDIRSSRGKVNKFSSTFFVSQTFATLIYMVN